MTVESGGRSVRLARASAYIKPRMMLLRSIPSESILANMEWAGLALDAHGNLSAIGVEMKAALLAAAADSRMRQ